MSHRLLPCACLAVLAGCNPGQDAAPAPPSAATTTGAVQVATTMPADPELARLYGQTCRTCHTTAATGAPLTGDRAAWAPRVAQGMPALIEHTVSGYKGMPPLGSCMDCTEQDFEALIRFMAGQPPA